MLIVPLASLDRSMLALGGGKAVNLGELLRAGLPVPDGVCLTTSAYAEAVAAAGIEPLIEELASADPARLPGLAAAIRDKLERAPLPEHVAAAVRSAVAELGSATPLAVRSSATAEDLPFASFAGQQDTYLRIVGADATLDAVRRCWASLWTERAVIYRHHQHVDQRGVRLAVVIQRLVDATVAGVLFTANPLTGRRDQAVIEASAGLGEAVVSGAVNPDHWVVDAAVGRVLEGPEPGCLTQSQLLTLVRLGQTVEALFGTPQDVEFAFDAAGTAWLVQARAITTLYPLPVSAPRDQHELRVYLSFNVAQGVLRPITPMGIDALGLFGISIPAALGIMRSKPVIIEAGSRLFIDLTPALRSRVWRRLVRTALSQGEARSAALIDQVLRDPRLAELPQSRRRTIVPILRALRLTRLPLRVIGALASPRRARHGVVQLRQAIEADGRLPPTASASERLDTAERLLLTWPRRLVPGVVPLLLVGLGSFALAERLLGDLAGADERDAVRRAVPHNPTTEMDLALWQLSRVVRSDEAARTALRARPPGDLAAEYTAGRLPGVLQRGLATFLASYGHRAIAEIDMGLPRWSEDPTLLLANLASYVAVDDGPQSAAEQFRSAAAGAERAVDQLARRAASRGRLRGVAVRYLLGRGRALAGLREMPKFLGVLVLARARALVLDVGRELVTAGRLDAAEDVFFLSLGEARATLAGADLRARIRERQARYGEELRRRHVPRLLLSDGTEPSLPVERADGDVLRGTPASAGRVTGRARVILEPAGARLEPGDILVAPSTDPGWTPLFLSAAGLVMEMGGAISHGAVVAREYGIPAVVGVAGASERIQDGERITIDGSQGTVSRAS